MNDDVKKKAAERATEFVARGQVVGLGTGSTSEFAIKALAKLVREGLLITGVPTSEAAANLARSLGIPLTDLNDVPGVDILIDGADEIDPAFNMIKGGGGALTREKLVALSSRRKIYVVDESKLVDRLGQSWAVPVEVLPFAWSVSARYLSELGCQPVLRGRPESPFLTDNGNYIVDCRFSSISDATQLERAIKQLPGVVESGLFTGIADVLVIGFTDRLEVRERPVS
jgi:ribose 5-phosphate isomerase A